MSNGGIVAFGLISDGNISFFFSLDLFRKNMCGVYEISFPFSWRGFNPRCKIGTHCCLISGMDLFHLFWKSCMILLLEAIVIYTYFASLSKLLPREGKKKKRSGKILNNKKRDNNFVITLVLVWYALHQVQFSLFSQLENSLAPSPQ